MVQNLQPHSYQRRRTQHIITPAHLCTPTPSQLVNGAYNPDTDYNAMADQCSIAFSVYCLRLSFYG